MNMPRFVILEHDHPHLHWDLMLETGEVLRTWRLESAPVINQTIAAQTIGDHRKAYLDYEGPVSGNRGSVIRWDAGAFAWVSQEPMRVTISLNGERCRGRAELACSGGDSWSFTWKSAED